MDHSRGGKPIGGDFGGASRRVLRAIYACRFYSFQCCCEYKLVNLKQTGPKDYKLFRFHVLEVPTVSKWTLKDLHGVDVKLSSHASQSFKEFRRIYLCLIFDGISCSAGPCGSEVLFCF